MSHFMSALTAIRRSPYQALAAILIITVTFFVGYCLSIFLFSANRLLEYFETRPQVTGFFKLKTPVSTVESVAKDFADRDSVASANIISQEKALEIYREANKDDPKMLELITADIFPITIEVAARDAQSLPTLAEDLKKVESIDQVFFQADIVGDLQRWTRSIRLVGLASVGLLTALSFLIVVIITGMKVAMKRRAIQVVSLLGATGWYIKSPFVYEGMLYGMVGSLMGWGGMYVGWLYLTPWLKSFVGVIPLFPLPPEFFLAQFGVGSLIGLLLGAFASSFAVQRMLHRASR